METVLLHKSAFLYVTSIFRLSSFVFANALLTGITKTFVPFYSSFPEILLVFCCSCPLLPISWAIGKILKVDIFDKSNPLGNVGFLFTCNQFLYLLIVMWVFNAVPDKMVMVYAMVFGAHLLPYSWLYKSISYRIFAIIIPVLSLVIGCIFSELFIALTLILVECIFVAALFAELGRFTNK